ncbi:MAG: PAS domain-containing protein [Calditrichaceae bacterium]|nr:PAS domain-containing protein [Calditrichaceae bacterium]HES60062.1 PAS domain-containing protein [Caldithrix sp.]
MPYKRLLFQIYLTFLVITFISLSTITWFAQNLARDFYLKETSRNLQDSAVLLNDQVLAALSDGQTDLLNTHIIRCDSLTKMRFTVILTNGKVVADSRENPNRMDNHAGRPEVKDAVAGRAGSSKRFSYTVEENLMYVAVPVKQDDKIIAVTRASISINAIEAALSSIINKFIITTIILILIIALIGWLVSRRISAPYEEIFNAIERVAHGDLNFRLNPTKSRVMKNLNEALNKMIVQIDEKIKTINQQSREQQAVLRSMAEGVIAVDSNKNIITMNTAAYKLLGLDMDQVEGRKIKEIVKYKELRKIITHAIKTNELIEDEIIIPPDDRYVQLHGTMLKNENGETIGALVVLNDVTRLRRLEVVRRDFVANVSHEIRTPLTSIKGFIETLLDGAIEEPDTAKRFLKIMIKQSNRLNSIIEDLLTLASIEESEKRQAVQFSKAKINKVIDSALSVCQPRAQNKNIALTVKGDDKIELMMNATLVEQALVNLIDNAVKYSAENTTVEIESVIEKDECVLNVKDQGIGVAKEQLPRIFERFYRVDKARSRTLGGTGLGLAIVKHIAKVHNGRVTVESTVGKGSIFRLILPKIKKAD